MSEEARKAMRKMSGVAVTATPSVFTHYSFPPTKTGRDAICSYMEVLKSMCAKVEGKPLGVKNWEELKCRTPAFFAFKFSHAKFNQKMTHDQQSMAVWERFRDVAPSKKGGTKGFRRFLDILSGIESQTKKKTGPIGEQRQQDMVTFGLVQH